MDLFVSEQYCSEMLEELKSVMKKEIVGKPLSTFKDGVIYRGLFFCKSNDPAVHITIQQSDQKNMNDDDETYLNISFQFYRGLRKKSKPQENL